MLVSPKYSILTSILPAWTCEERRRRPGRVQFGQYPDILRSRALHPMEPSDDDENSGHKEEARMLCLACSKTPSCRTRYGREAYA